MKTQIKTPSRKTDLLKKLGLVAAIVGLGSYVAISPVALATTLAAMGLYNKLILAKKGFIFGIKASNNEEVVKEVAEKTTDFLVDGVKKTTGIVVDGAKKTGNVEFKEKAEVFQENAVETAEVFQENAVENVEKELGEGKEIKEKEKKTSLEKGSGILGSIGSGIISFKFAPVIGTISSIIGGVKFISKLTGTYKEFKEEIIKWIKTLPGPIQEPANQMAKEIFKDENTLSDTESKSSDTESKSSDTSSELVDIASELISREEHPHIKNGIELAANKEEVLNFVDTTANNIGLGEEYKEIKEEAGKIQNKIQNYLKEYVIIPFKGLVDNLNTKQNNNIGKIAIKTIH